ncbi:hypothetical protein [Paraburkholderia sp. JHI869]|uniref:hypothetical protein n=1 Tax=Paraburkholderia sp. JHI869 TaxID=3112959 RepID=UPI0031782131
MNQKSFSLNTDPYALVSAVLSAICLAVPDEQRHRIASELRAYAERVNEDAENVDQQQFALDVASLAALAEDGSDAACKILGAGLPR